MVQRPAGLGVLWSSGFMTRAAYEQNFPPRLTRVSLEVPGVADRHLSLSHCCSGVCPLRWTTSQEGGLGVHLFT